MGHDQAQDIPILESRAEAAASANPVGLAAVGPPGGFRAR